ncbi:PREDICTED: uncharacterized protein LOC109236592 [Nicotiana attenuata]|uniref:uncharacterized protein LOC109236592 n=1 Tax=Nicotiana attenuata TaxID=49451 RepID=UPI0009059B20|nr:PREDICTED: uncharacterized protein LOC109236592 [Nicotiana attenuata]
MYGFNTTEARKPLWQQLKADAPQNTEPWIIWGDFNSVLTIQGRICGKIVTSNEIQDFNECMQTLNLNELAWRGDYYTWSNKQQGVDIVYSRIDRVLGNDKWIHDYEHIEVEYRLPFISEHPSFMSLVEGVWKEQYDHDPMRNIWQKLKILRSLLKLLNNSEFKGITDKLESTRSLLQGIQAQILKGYSDKLANEEKQALENLEK